MLRITVSTNTDSLDHYIQKLGNLRGGYENIGEAMVERVSTTFMESRSPWGGAWKQWSETTRELQKRGGLFGATRRASERLLMNTGTLRNSVISIPEASRVEIKAGGAASAYAWVHQFGNPNNRLPNRPGGSRAPIPARPYMPVTKGGRPRVPREWMTLALERFEDWLEMGAP